MRAACLSLLIFLLLPPFSAGAAPCADTLDPGSPILANGFAADLANSRHYASLITSANVATLELAWADVADGVKEKRGAPAMTQQAVFFAAGRQIIAASRRDGCRYWTYTVAPRLANLLSARELLRSSAFYFLPPQGEHPALVFAGDYYGTIYALDAASGALLWSRFVGTDTDHHMITGAPQFFDGTLLVPVASKEVLTALSELRPCCSSHGLLQALDAYSGATLWTYHTTADAVYQFGSGKMAPNGASVWSTPAIDTHRRRIYIGTGQNFTPPTTDNSDSIVALDFDTGTPLWTFQSTAGDAFTVACGLPPLLGTDCARPPGPDFDFGAPPMLVHLPGGRDTVIAGAKNGVVYSLDPDSGGLNWSRRIGVGGALGGIHWGTANDGARVYAAVSDVTVNKASGLALGKLLGLEVAQVEGARSGLYALDANSGTVLWEAHPTHDYEGAATPSIYSAALTATNDLVFAGALDGELKALRSSDGTVLWTYASAAPVTGVDGTAGRGGTIDSVGAIVGGDSLLLNSGYDTFGTSSRFQAGPGNALYVLRLPAR